MSGPNGAPEYKIIAAAAVTQRVKSLHLQAAALGFGEAFRDALIVVARSLVRDPRQFGDPLYRLPALKLTLFHRAVFPLAVDYGVHDKLPLVIVRGFRLMV